jgi:predicted lipoprotein with Yx(FWY)xxD motif
MGDAMKGIALILIVAAALSLAGLGTGLASGSGSRGATVSTAKTGLRKVIVNLQGRTLYLFEKDKRGKSACSGACASYWPPLITHGSPIAVNGAKQSLLGTIKRANGAARSPTQDTRSTPSCWTPSAVRPKAKVEALRRWLGCADARWQEDRA